jgi:hypothetical protein
MKLVPRAAWGARPFRTPSGATVYSSARSGVKIHYLGTPYTERLHEQCAAYVRALQASHMDGNGWSDIGYSFVVCTHGYVFEGRGLKRRNSANGSTSLNERHYAVCALVGNSGVTRPTDAQLHGLRDAIEYCRSEGPAGSQVLGHRDGYSTDCPGGPLYTWVQQGAPRPTVTIPPIPTGDTPMNAVDYWSYRNPDLEPADDAYALLRKASKNPWAYRNEELNSQTPGGIPDAYGYLRAIHEAVSAPVPVEVDADAVVAALAARPELVDAIAEAVAAKIAKRLEA